MPWRHLCIAPYLEAWSWEEQCTMGSDGNKQRQLFGNHSRLWTIKPIVNKISTLTEGPFVLVQMTYVCSWAVVKHSTWAWAGKSTKNKLQATREDNYCAPFDSKNHQKRLMWKRNHDDDDGDMLEWVRGDNRLGAGDHYVPHFPVNKRASHLRAHYTPRTLTRAHSQYTQKCPQAIHYHTHTTFHSNVQNTLAQNDSQTHTHNKTLTHTHSYIHVHLETQSHSYTNMQLASQHSEHTQWVSLTLSIRVAKFVSLSLRAELATKVSSGAYLLFLQQMRRCCTKLQICKFNSVWYAIYTT